MTGSWKALVPQEMVLREEPVVQEEVDPLIGMIIDDKYEIVEILGRGAMAVVYLGRQLSTNRLVAMKRLSVNSTEAIMRFSREIRNHSQLSHRNIVEYIEFVGSKSGLFFLVMERIKGPSLQEIIRAIGRIDDTDNIGSIMNQACDALSYAHSHGLVHRDLKMSNIVLVKEGDSDDIVVKILDFGIAKAAGQGRITLSGHAVGSPLYMSPEQCMGKELTHLSDIYSLGVVAYETFTGQAPYAKGSLKEILRAHCTPEIRPRPIGDVVPHIAASHLLDQIVFRALETDPALRWQDASQLQAAFEYWYNIAKTGRRVDMLPESIWDPKPVVEEMRQPTGEVLRATLTDMYMEEAEQLDSARRKLTIRRKKKKQLRTVLVVVGITVALVSAILVIANISPKSTNDQPQSTDPKQTEAE